LQSPAGDAGTPLFSVICFCKNRASLIRRSIDSVLNQTYRNLEFVVQDGASTDGTLEILHEYAARDSRVKIVSEPDSGPAEAYWKVLQRCSGDYIATCLSDEELVPDALEKAARWFAAQPSMGAFTCDGHTTDADGKTTGAFTAGEFDFVAYLFLRYCPFWPGSFFRRKALLDIGLGRPDGWTIGCLEFEIWCRLARDHEVRYVPELISKYAVHPGQLSNTPANFFEHIDSRLRLIEKMFAPDGFFGAEKYNEWRYRINLRYDIYRDYWFHALEAKINQLAQFEFHAKAHKLPREEAEFARRIADVKKQIVARYDHNIAVEKVPDRDPNIDGETRQQRVLAQFWHGWEAVTGVPRASTVDDPTLDKKFKSFRSTVERQLIRGSQPLHDALRLAGQLQINEDAAPEFKQFAEQHRAERLGRFYDKTARIYEARGQISEAVAMWRRAEVLHDRDVDGHACQQALKDPAATYESLAATQQRWVDEHVRVDPTRMKYDFAAFDGGRKLRIGYHCSFMDSDTIRFIMRRAIAAHDRDHFEVMGYAPSDLPDDMRSAFDAVRNTGALSDSEFVDQVRRDGIDVFVELTGLSPGHRYGAMAERCARVQVSYLNHFATSRIPAVDYVLSDEICTPPGSGAYATFTEAIQLLPGCLLRFDYTDDVASPPVARLPSLANGFITFGCLGRAGKFNTRIVEMWAEIMSRVPRSKILLQHPQFDPVDNRRYMRDRFARAGIAADRVIIRLGTTRPNILEAYSEIDISFDTWPYCGGNTVAEALWAGVPVITLKGELFCSRYGASLLQAASCPEFIANSRAEYVDLAVRLAEDQDRLIYYRDNLRRLYTEGGLNDSSGFARNLEHAYLKMMAVAVR